MTKYIFIHLMIGLISFQGLAFKMPPADEIREIIESIMTACEPEFLELTELDLFIGSKNLEVEQTKILLDYAFQLYERNQEERLTAFPSIRNDLKEKKELLLQKLFKPRLFINPPLTFEKPIPFGKNAKPIFLSLQRLNFGL